MANSTPEKQASAATGADAGYVMAKIYQVVGTSAALALQNAVQYMSNMQSIDTAVQAVAASSIVRGNAGAAQAMSEYMQQAQEKVKENFLQVSESAAKILATFPKYEVPADPGSKEQVSSSQASLDMQHMAMTEALSLMMLNATNAQQNAHVLNSAIVAAASTLILSSDAGENGDEIKKLIKAAGNVTNADAANADKKASTARSLPAKEPAQQ